jgi:hypothetical protein
VHGRGVTHVVLGEEHDADVGVGAGEIQDGVPVGEGRWGCCVGGEGVEGAVAQSGSSA